MYNQRLFSYFLIFLSIFPLYLCIFSVPDLSETSNKITTYTIDFRGIDTPESTYWSLANFHLDTSDFEETHSDVSGGGAYAGLQTLYNGERVAIMSFWKINYKENGEEKDLRFNRIYPSGDEMNFSGEGEGTTYRAPYNWESNVWYRFVLHTWEDYTRKTFIGVWIQNLSTKEWTLFAYFNTNLSYSYIGGGYGALAFFQEIFSSAHLKKERQFQIKNMYVFDKVKKEWASINKSHLYYNENPEINKGIGYTPFYFYGFSGPHIDGQNEEKTEKEFTASITQPKTPDFDKPVLKKFEVEMDSHYLKLKWEWDSTSCPIYQYTITYEDVLYGIKNTYRFTRPEKDQINLASDYESGIYKITFTALAISNQFITKQVERTI